jgi:hypothetical protein
MATLYQMTIRALDEISSFTAPTFLIGSTDDTAKQLLALAKKVGTELIRDYDWQEMIREATFTTTADITSYDVETDYERIVPDTTWNRTSQNSGVGNATARQWSILKALNTPTAGEYYFRIIRRQVQLQPSAVAGSLTFAYEYLSKNYCESSGGIDQAEWTADTDVPLLPEDLFINGIRYYFLKANNLPYGDAEAEYDAVIQSRLNKNVPSGAVNMASGVRVPGRDNYRLNIPDVIQIP